MKKPFICIILGAVCAIETSILVYFVFYPNMHHVWMTIFFTSIINFVCMMVLEHFYFAHDKTFKVKRFYVPFFIGIVLGSVCAMLYTAYTSQAGRDTGFAVIETGTVLMIIWIGIFLCRAVLWCIDFFCSQNAQRNRIEKPLSCKQVGKVQVFGLLFSMLFLGVWALLIQCVL